MNAKGVTEHMRVALKILQKDPEAYYVLHTITLSNLSKLELAYPVVEPCPHCGTRIHKGWFLTDKGRAEAVGLQLVSGGEDGAP